MTASTPVYGIEYILPGEPIRNTRAALQANAETIEAALVRGGIAPPEAQDLATLSGRVSTLETEAAALTAQVTPGPWTAFPLVGAPFLTSYVPGAQQGGGLSGPPAVQYRIWQRRVYLRGWGVSANGGPAGGIYTTSAGMPAAARPAVMQTLFVPADGPTVGALYRLEMDNNGLLYGVRAIPANTFLCFDGMSYELD